MQVRYKMRRLMLLYAILFGFLFSCAHSEAVKTESENKFNPISDIVRFYRGPLNHFSAVRQSECPMYPSCSQYSLQSLHQHGLFMGWMMTCDRLMRCGRDELKLSPDTSADGKWKCYDPVENNDFWWNPR